MIRPHIHDRSHWAFASFVLIISGIIALIGDAGRELFSYKNGLFSHGELWRAITGHLTHLGWPHFLLNGFGLLGVWSLYGKRFAAKSWAIIFLLCAVGISVGFATFDKTLQNYVGLSGILHGLISAAAINSLILSRQTDKGFPTEDLFVLAALALKIIYEKCIGSVPFTSTLSGGNVVVNAHFYGAIIGTIAGGGSGLFTKMRAPDP